MNSFSVLHPTLPELSQPASHIRRLSLWEVRKQLKLPGPGEGKVGFQSNCETPVLAGFILFSFLLLLKRFVLISLSRPTLASSTPSQTFVLLGMESAMDPAANMASTKHCGLCSHVRVRLWVSRHKPLTICLGTAAGHLYFGIKDNPSTRNLRQPSLVRGCIVVCQMLEHSGCL